MIWFFGGDFFFFKTFFFCDPIRDPIHDPIHDPIRDPILDPVRSRFCRRRPATKLATFAIPASKHGG